jgi:hypothetical protein
VSGACRADIPYADRALMRRVTRSRPGAARCEAIGPPARCEGIRAPMSLTNVSRHVSERIQAPTGHEFF